jgi:hypothetical protein
VGILQKKKTQGITTPKKGLDSAYFHFRQRFTSAVYFGAVKSIDSAFAYTKNAVIGYY